LRRTVDFLCPKSVRFTEKGAAPPEHSNPYVMCQSATSTAKGGDCPGPAPFALITAATAVVGTGTVDDDSLVVVNGSPAVVEELVLCTLAIDVVEA
jgi:hypothetical protein